MTAKQLEIIGNKLNFKPKEKEFIDLDGYYQDGKRVAKNGLTFSIGSLKLKENIEAFKRGYYEK